MAGQKAYAIAGRGRCRLALAQGVGAYDHVPES